MNISRRMVAPVLSGLVAGAKSALASPLPVNDAGLKAALGQARGAHPVANNAPEGSLTPAQPIKMPWEQAYKIASNDPELRQYVYDYYLSYVNVTHIDIDILNKRSWSDSFKILQQRKRNAQRATDGFFDGHSKVAPNDPWLLIQKFVKNLVFGDNT